MGTVLSAQPQSTCTQGEAGRSMRALHDMPRVTVVLVRLGGSSRLQNLSLTPQLSQQTSCKTSLHIIKGITHPSPPHPQRSINFTYVHYFSLKVQTLLLGLFHMRWPRCAGAVAFRDKLFCFTALVLLYCSGGRRETSSQRVTDLERL